MTQSIDLAEVAVLGFGTMGAGIAQVVAESGRRVVVLETDQERLDAGRARLSAFLDEGIRRGKRTTDEKAAVLDRVVGVSSVSALVEDGRSPELVIESVSEDADVKRPLLADVAGVVGADVPIVTNTSALSVTELAMAVPRPERVAGLHFFNPVPLMRTVEVVRAFHTDAALVDRLAAFVGSLDSKDAVVTKDRPGFLINALLMPYLNDVVQAYDDELASAEDIDIALKLGLGYKSGPLEMLDMIGLDVHLNATRNAFDATHDRRYSPPPLLQQMVTAGALGNKSGRGFRIDSNDKDR